jgi:hypothetical protein
MLKYILTSATYAAIALSTSAQVSQNGFLLERDLSIPVTEMAATLDQAWAGGMNFCQYSDIDFNLDGVNDLFVFDRSGNKVIPFINLNVAGQSSYQFAPEYADVWPFNKLHDWVLLRDYNCDGKSDIFTYSIGGMAIYRNVSTATQLQFVLEDTLVLSNYQPTVANLFVTSTDIPGIADVDFDGDLDVLTFSIFGSFLEYHKNLSVESGFGCDSIMFEIRNRCWGSFAENINNNSVSLDISCPNIPSPESDDAESGGIGGLRHVGSTVTPLDLDGNAVMDVILGDISYNNLNALYNDGGTASSHIGSQDSVFPVYDVPVDVQIFPAAFYVDVNNDARRDLLVSPNNRSLSRNFTSSWFYENTGTDAAPVFSLSSTDLIQGEMIDLGEGAYPVPFDYNSDGRMDLIVANYGYFDPSGNYPSQLALFSNIGTATMPEFELIDRDFGGLGSSTLGQALYPTFGDLDGDQDQDMIIGDLQGKMHFFTNDPVGGQASFTLTATDITDINGSVMDVGQFAAPQLFDVNGDTLLDLLVGERNGNINYYQNLGTATAPSWALIHDTIGDVVVTEYWNITGYSTPHMYFNNNGEREMLVGSESGFIHLYDNIDNNLNGVWNQVDSAFQNIRTGVRTGICVADYTGDNKLDVIVGNYRGGIGFWRNDFQVGIVDKQSNNSTLTIYPNPAQDRITINLQDRVPEGTIEVYNAIGELIRIEAASNRTRLIMDVSDLPAGTFLVRLNESNSSSSSRFVISR